MEKPGFYGAFFGPSWRVYHVYQASVTMMNSAPPMTKMFMLSHFQTSEVFGEPEVHTTSEVFAAS